MTKSKGKGGKNRRKCKRGAFNSTKRPLEFKDNDQDYAIILERKGGPIVTLKCFDTNEEKLGVIRGTMRKREWLSSGNIVLIGIRDFQKEKVDILMKYNDEEVRKLIQYGELTNNFVNSKNSLDEDFDDIGFEFKNIDDI